MKTSIYCYTALTLVLTLLTTISNSQSFNVYVSDAGNFNNPPWQILKYDSAGQNPTVFINNNLNPLIDALVQNKRSKAINDISNSLPTADRNDISRALDGDNYAINRIAQQEARRQLSKQKQTKDMLEIPQGRLAIEIGTGMVHGVFDQDRPILAEKRIARGALDAHIGGHTGEQQIANIFTAQIAIQIRPPESAIA